ncbi:MAG: hypothetical protein Kow00121_63820 [Elainellaceae cyanobacterium]
MNYLLIPIVSTAFVAAFLMQPAGAASIGAASTAPSSSQQTPSGELQLAQTEAALNLESRYQENIIVRITDVAFTRNNIILALEATNGSETTIELNSNTSGEGIILVDDLGNQYSFVPPRNNPSVGLQPGAELRGEFVFSGSVSPSANSLTLIINSGVTQDEMVPTNTPKITISDIPVSF